MAQTVPNLLAIEASAGSGKTYNLSRRYIEIVLDRPFPESGCNFRNILAITFTNEAANEMKRRIFNVLKAIALRDRRYLRMYNFEEFSPGMKDQAQYIVNDIVRNYSDFNIKTIDSFMHSILMSSALQLELPPYREIMEESSSYLDYVLDDFLEDSLKDEDFRKLMDLFIESYLFVENRKSWFPKNDILGILQLLNSKQNERGKTFGKEEMRVTDASIEEELKDLLRRLFAEMEKSGIKVRSDRRLKPAVLERRGKSFLTEVFEGADAYQKHLFKTEPPQPVRKTWDRIDSLLDKASHYYTYHTYSFYIDIFKGFETRLQEFKFKKRVVFLEELSRRAREYIHSVDLGNIPEIFYKLSSVFFHFLIDEFQDTSRLQWESLDILAEEALARGGSLFYVGDKKQAIYRFRGGDVSLFDEVYRNFQDRVQKAQEIVLEHNFRSKKEIVDFNGSLFSGENISRFLDHNRFQILADADRDAVMDNFKNSGQKVKEGLSGGYVKVRSIPSAKEEPAENIIKTEFLDTVKELLTRYSPAEIMVLARRKEEVSLITRWLLEENFPTESLKTVDIRENYLVREVLSFLKFLHSPIDNLAFASFISGDLFAEHLKNRQDLGKNESSIRVYLENLSLDGAGGVLYRKFQEDFPGLWEECLEYFFKSVGFLPPYELVFTFFMKIGAFGNFPEQIPFFLHFLEVLKELESRKKNNVMDVLEMFGSGDTEEDSSGKFLVKTSGSTHRIKVYTIHKAKGLESKVVIIPLLKLYPEITPARQAGRVIHENQEELNLLYIKKSFCRKDPLRKILREQLKMSALDELNALYVALTRAKEELYVYMPASPRNLAQDFIRLEPDSEIMERGKITAASDLAEKEDRAQKIAPKIPVTVTDPYGILKDNLYEEVLREREFFSPETLRQIRKGEVVHCALSLIGHIEGQDLNSLIKEKVSLACLRFSYPGQEEITGLLLKIFSNQDFRKFFKEGPAVFNEKEVITRTGLTRRMDRLIIGERTVTILDYKTGSAREEDREQILEYCQLLRDIYGGKEIEGYLVYLETGKIEKVSPPRAP